MDAESGETDCDQKTFGIKIHREKIIFHGKEVPLHKEKKLKKIGPFEEGAYLF